MDEQLQRFRVSHGLRPHVAKKRMCMFCGLMFDSTWSGHRTCAKCKAKIHRAKLDDEHYVVEHTEEPDHEPISTPC